jgi:sarcosine reductase
MNPMLREGQITMRLELHIIRIQEVRFGAETRIDNGVLTINRQELKELLEGDRRLGKVDIEIAHPGEKCRILQVGDVIEPRAKMGSAVENIWGPAGTHPTTGEGKTYVLRGAAIVISDNKERGTETISAEPHGAIIDMAGPGSEVSEFGKTQNIVLLPQPKGGVGALDYQAALKVAELKAAVYLGRAGQDQKPDETEIYDLPPLTEIARGFEGLPKVTYIAQVISLQFEPVPGEPVLFGQQAGGILPTILHPNQVLDGAVTSPFPGLNVQTYHIQNHPIIKELYKRHGKDLCFTGVIATIAPNNVSDFERMANIAASLAKWVLGADGAILTKTAGGAPELAMARTAQRCEQLGIKTAIAMLHMGADVRDAKYGASTIFSMPEVDAIVSMGTPYTVLTLPRVNRVIGRPGFAPEDPPIGGEIIRPLSGIKGALCQMGSSRLTAVRH